MKLNELINTKIVDVGRYDISRKRGIIVQQGKKYYAIDLPEKIRIVEVLERK